jgi:hypothetical protein
MDMKKISIRKDLQRMVINYYLMGGITEDISAQLCELIDNTIGGDDFPRIGELKGRNVIPFPTSYTGPEETTEKKTVPEIYAPYDEALPEGIEDFREILQRDGLVLICYQKLASREGTFFDVLWAQSGTRIRCTNWSGAIREECLPYVMPLDGIEDNYKYDDFRKSLKTVYTVNVAPENVLNGPMTVFSAYVQSLKDAGMKNDFDYIFIFAAEKRNRFLTRNKELVDLKIPVRVLSSLDKGEIHTLNDLQRLSIQELRKIRHLSPKMANDTIAILKKAGITLQDEKENYKENLRDV